MICGARNFKVNDLVVVAIPGAVLPGNFVISARETYGKISDGMICSAKELGISEEHAGIIVLPEGKVGSDAIKLLEIEDIIFDVAIKDTTTETINSTPTQDAMITVTGSREEGEAGTDLTSQMMNNEASTKNQTSNISTRAAHLRCRLKPLQKR